MSGRAPARADGSDHRGCVLISVENCPAAEDHRVAMQIGSLVEAGYQVRVIAQGSPENAVHRGRTRLRAFAHPPLPRGFSPKACLDMKRTRLVREKLAQPGRKKVRGY
jgi:hypothetical protein